MVLMKYAWYVFKTIFSALNSSSGPQEQEDSGAFAQSTAILYFKNMKIALNSTPQVPQVSLLLLWYFHECLLLGCLRQ
jgi:hypothetical protein